MVTLQLVSAVSIWRRISRADCRCVCSGGVVVVVDFVDVGRSGGNEVVSLLQPCATTTGVILQESTIK